MSKKDPLAQAQKLEEKIREMQEKKRQYIDKAHKEVGQYLMETWDIEDINQAKRVIAALKERAQHIFTNPPEEIKTEEVVNAKNG